MSISSTLRNRLRTLVRHGQSTTAFGIFLIAHERVVARIVRVFLPRPNPTARYELVLLASDGNGNIGDQAMVEAVCDRVDGPVLVIAESKAAVQWDSARNPEMSVVVIEGLLSRWRPLAFRRTMKLMRHLTSARRFGVIGADVMDGVYSPISSVLRNAYALVATDCGVPARVLGFSWSAQATRSATYAIRKSAPHIRVIPRDPLSNSRLRSAGVAPLRAGADVVFTATSTEPVPELRWLRESGFVIVNASGLIARQNSNFIDEYRQILDAVDRETGLTPVLLPHVHRERDNDLAALRKIRDESGNASMVLVEDLLSPAQVRWLASEARLVVTGRMHLAIMALNVGTVPVTLSTVGKVEGLYELFGLTDLVVDSSPGYGKKVARVIEAIAPQLDSHAARIATALPRVREMSTVNFDDVPSHPFNFRQVQVERDARR